MKQLSNTQSATALVEDINANLQEMSSAVEVAVTDSATALVEELKAVLDIDTLSVSDNSQSFINKLNTAFADAQDTAPIIDGIDVFNESRFGAEMNDTMNKLTALKDNTDLILLVSTDLHHEVPTTHTFTKNGIDYTINTNAHTFTNTFSSLLSNQKELIDRLTQNRFNVDGIVCLGDIMHGHRKHYQVDGTVVVNANEIVDSYVRGMLDKFKSLSDAYDIPFLLAIGNHDDNQDSNNGDAVFSYQELDDMYLRDYVTRDGKDDYLDYYVDFESTKIRVVVLFCQNAATSNTYCVPTHSKPYLKSCIDTMPQGYQALVLCHLHPVMSSNIEGTNELMDYIADNTDKIIGYLCGHWHWDFVRGYPVTAFALCCNLNNEGNGGHPNDGKDMWSVIAIDKTNKVINMVRFAAHSSGFGMYYTQTVDGVEVQKLQTGYIDRRAHYEIINGVVGQTYTFKSTLDGDITWLMNSYSWYRQVTSSTTGNTNYSAGNYAEIISTSGDTCTINVKAQDTSYPQFVSVVAQTSTAYEYWTIKIPKSS